MNVGHEPSARPARRDDGAGEGAWPPPRRRCFVRCYGRAVISPPPVVVTFH